MAFVLVRDGIALLMLYETPRAVATALARHAPRAARRILDPAVGCGALLDPLVRRSELRNSLVVGVDCDPRAIQHCNDHLRRVHRNVRLVQSDFLADACLRDESFDCIIMNPPFGGKRTQLKEVIVPDSMQRAFKTRLVPVEAAFFLKAFSLLSPGGRILSIFPSSFVSGGLLHWLREGLLGTGSVHCVHELPKRTFSSVEARVYLFVYEKGKPNRASLLCNHDVIRPEKMAIRFDTSVDSDVRFDFSFHSARLQAERLRRHCKFGWCDLGEVARIIRGKGESPGGARRGMHTTDYVDGFWRRHNRHRFAEGSSTAIREGDILLKRVGRGCGGSFGVTSDGSGVECSDCVWIIRPHEVGATLRLLFSLRVVCEMGFGRSILERGSGAVYITADSLQHFPVPMRLADRYPAKFAHFKTAVEAGASCEAERAVSDVRSRILRRMDAAQLLPR